MLLLSGARVLTVGENTYKYKTEVPKLAEAYCNWGTGANCDFYMHAYECVRMYIFCMYLSMHTHSSPNCIHWKGYKQRQHSSNAYTLYLQHHSMLKEIRTLWKSWLMPGLEQEKSKRSLSILLQWGSARKHHGTRHRIQAQTQGMQKQTSRNGNSWRRMLVRTTLLSQS